MTVVAMWAMRRMKRNMNVRCLDITAAGNMRAAGIDASYAELLIEDRIRAASLADSPYRNNLSD